MVYASLKEGRDAGLEPLGNPNDSKTRRGPENLCQRSRGEFVERIFAQGHKISRTIWSNRFATNNFRPTSTEIEAGIWEGVKQQNDETPKPLGYPND